MVAEDGGEGAEQAFGVPEAALEIELGGVVVAEAGGEELWEVAEEGYGEALGGELERGDAGLLALVDAGVAGADAEACPVEVGAGEALGRHDVERGRVGLVPHGVAGGGGAGEEVFVLAALGEGGVVAAQGGEEITANEDVVGGGVHGAAVVAGGEFAEEVFAEDAAGAGAEVGEGVAFGELQRECAADAGGAGGVGQAAEFLEPVREGNLVVVEAG